MPIFDKEKMKQKVVYPTEQTPSYADWALFEMGKELEESGSGGTAYTAGSGIAISEENVISNTAQPDVTKEYVDGADVNLQQQIQGKVNINLDNVNVGSATAGQVVKVNNSANGVEFGDVPKELPPIASGDAGKVLQVNSGETGVEWDSVNEVPAPTASDVNKVLTATAANAFAWMAAGGGSGSQWNNVYSIMDLNRNDIFIGRVVTDDPDSQLFTNYVIGIVGSANATIISFSNCIAIDSTGTALSGAQEFEGFTTYYVTGIKYTLQ